MIFCYRDVYPDFLPPAKPEQRHLLREKIEREDMIKRRHVLEVPEFYVGKGKKLVYWIPNVKRNFFTRFYNESQII